MRKQYETIPIIAMAVPQVAQALQVCETRVREEIKKGRLRAFKIGIKLRVRRDEVEDYMMRMEDGNFLISNGGVSTGPLFGQQQIAAADGFAKTQADNLSRSKGPRDS